MDDASVGLAGQNLREDTMRYRITALATLTLLASAAPAWAILDCANYISGSLEGGPVNGHLLGEQLVTEEFSFGVDAGLDAGLRGTVQYKVGTYELSDGRRIKVDCRTYTAV